MNKLKEFSTGIKDFKFHLEATVESENKTYTFTGTSDLSIAPLKLKSEFEEYLNSTKSCDFITKPFKNKYITIIAVEANDKVTLENYQSLARQTCLPSSKNWEYCFCEITSELGEAFGKWGKIYRDGSFDKDKLTDELGDVFWGIALGCDLAGLKFEYIWNFVPSDMDKLYVYFVLPNSYKDIPKEMKDYRLAEIMQFTKRFAMQCEIDPMRCLERNIEKLSKRKANKTLTGNGDDR